jgi:hypothetical protein
VWLGRLHRHRESSGHADVASADRRGSGCVMCSAHVHEQGLPRLGRWGLIALIFELGLEGAKIWNFVRDLRRSWSKDSEMKCCLIGSVWVECMSSKEYTRFSAVSCS